MPSMAEPIQRAPFLERLSEASRHRETFDLDMILDDLHSPTSLVDLARRYGLLADEEEERHLREDWYNETGNGWWPQFPVEAIVRRGYIEMIELVRAHDLPVDALWITDQTDFRVALARSPNQITMIFQTPPCRTRSGFEDRTLRVIEAGAGGSVEVRSGSRG
jgi:hypothetical protein